MPLKVNVTTSAEFTAEEHKALKKQFKSVTVALLGRRKRSDPSISNVETTIRRRRRKKKAAAKKSAAKKSAAKKSAAKK